MYHYFELSPVLSLDWIQVIKYDSRKRKQEVLNDLFFNEVMSEIEQKAIHLQNKSFKFNINFIICFEYKLIPVFGVSCAYHLN